LVGQMSSPPYMSTAQTVWLCYRVLHPHKEWTLW